jgi:hypothetical protein
VVVAKNDERKVLFFEIKVLTKHQRYVGLPAFHFSVLAAAIDGVFKAGHAERSQNGGRETIYIGDMKVTRKHVSILVNISDRAAADPVVTNRKRKTRKEIVKNQDEGLDYSCHIVVSLAPSTKDQDAYPARIEVATGLASSRIQMFLNRILRLVSKSGPVFTLQDPEATTTRSGAYKTIRVRPHIELRGFPSSTFLEDLKKGELSDLELYTYKDHAKPWDSNAYVVEDKSGVVLKPNPRKVAPKALQAVKGVLSNADSKKYEQAKIIFKNESGVSKSVRIYTDDLHLVNDMKYVKKEIIDKFSKSLPSSFEVIDQEVEAKMISLL